MKKKLKALWKAINGMNKKGKWVSILKNPPKPPDGYSQSIILSGLYKLHEAGFKGKGVSIAVIGSGLEFIPALASIEHKITRESFVPGENATIDPEFHESFIASQILATTPLKVGTAPEIDHYYNLKIMNRSRGWTPDMMAAALEYIVKLPENERPNIISISIAVHIEDSALTDDFKACHVLFEKLKSMGVYILATTGNNGKDNPGWPARYVNSVGALNLDGTLWINSTKPAKYVFYGNNVEGLARNGTIIKQSGTSFSCPQLAGFIACYLSKKIAGGNNIKQIITSLDTSLKLDNYISTTNNGLLVNVP